MAALPAALPNRDAAVGPALSFQLEPVDTRPGARHTSLSHRRGKRLKVDAPAPPLALLTASTNAWSKHLTRESKQQVNCSTDSDHVGTSCHGVIHTQHNSSHIPQQSWWPIIASNSWLTQKRPCTALRSSPHETRSCQYHLVHPSQRQVDIVHQQVNQQQHHASAQQQLANSAHALPVRLPSQHPNPLHVLLQHLSAGKLLLAGGLSAVVSRTAVAPLERVKMDQLLKSSSRSALDTAKCVYHREGVAGFWKGNALNILRTAPFKV